MPKISDVLHARAYEYEKRTGYRPKTLNITHDEYAQLCAEPDIQMYGVFGTKPSPRGGLHFCGFKLRIRNYEREGLLKERRVARGAVRAKRRHRPPALTFAAAQWNDALMAGYLQNNPNARMRLVP